MPVGKGERLLSVLVRHRDDLQGAIGVEPLRTYDKGCVILGSLDFNAVADETLVTRTVAHVFRKYAAPGLPPCLSGTVFHQRPVKRAAVIDDLGVGGTVAKVGLRGSGHDVLRPDMGIQIRDRMQSRQDHPLRCRQRRQPSFGHSAVSVIFSERHQRLVRWGEPHLMH